MLRKRRELSLGTSPAAQKKTRQTGRELLARLLRGGGEEMILD